tara:strand:+ start:149 stop:628 length:480 start_codon:yes stop_codon:yes gene_type:complete
MRKYSKERKAHVIKQMLPPMGCLVSELSRKEGIPTATLYAWRSAIQTPGGNMSAKSRLDQWSAEQKLACVVTTYSMNTAEFNEYCRKNGMYPEHINEWKLACLSAYSTKKKGSEVKSAHKIIKQLKKEISRKDKALSETATLLALGKKYDALWSEKEEC